ncbi:MAG TPA: VCBS repeat-containing protein, partial [Bacteroidota bacterium]|nr:VCBS repeat-containing protein [Bacteroidota bacterium]
MRISNFNKIFTIFILFVFYINLAISEEPNPSWITDITKEVGLESARGSRIALYDINGDNYPDLLWSEGTTNKNRLHILLNVPNPDASSNIKRIFIEWTDSSGININRDPNKKGRIADIGAFVDVNNDGYPDLVSSIYYHRLQMYLDTLDPGDRSEVYLNDGTGHFKLLSNSGLYQLGLVNTTGLGFLDYDLDGNLDLFMAQWFYDYANDKKQPSILLKGNGDGSFTKVNCNA